MKPKKTINLKHPEYQPSKAELEQPVKVDVTGKDTMEKMERLAKSAVHSVNIRYRP
ncbi:MAG: hypothetical protein OXE97_09500 [Gammaproteobacteria bacterium]|nr:hypothetical protein [Gammaproteobacteria bacterium]